MPSKNMPSILMKRFLRKEIGNSKRVLDIGCGDGALARYLISYLNCRVDGVDADRGKVHRANEKFKRQITKGLALCCLCNSNDINKKFKKKTFDIVIINHVLHHLIDLNVTLLKIRHVLKKGGRLFIAEYERDYGEKIDNCPRFSDKKIKSMLKTAGFRNVINNAAHQNFVMITAKNGGRLK